MLKILHARLPARWKTAFFGGTALLVTVGIGGGLMMPEAAKSVARQAQDLAGLISARSPGERKVGELTKTKSAAAGRQSSPNLVKDESPPQERALGKVFRPAAGNDQGVPIPGLLDSPLNDALTGIPTGLISGPLAFIPGNGFPGSGSAFSPPGFGGGGLFLPPAGGTALAPPPESPSSPAAPELSAVPEPSTWIVLIVGFALCAASMRKRNRVGVCRGMPQPR